MHDIARFRATERRALRSRLTAALLALAALLAVVAAGCADDHPSTAAATVSTSVVTSATTPPPSTSPQVTTGSSQHVVYAVGDDTQPGNEAVSRRLAAQVPLPSQGLELFIYLGDVRPTGSSEDFARYDAIYGSTGHDLRLRTVSLIGNHEWAARDEGWIPYWTGALIPPWPGSLTQVDPPYYTFELGDWKFIVMDTNSPLDADSEQYAFLVAELQEPGFHCVVCGHDPRWSNGSHGNDRSLDAAWKAMCDYGAAVYLSGHDHGSQIQPRRDRDGNVVQSGGCVQLIAAAGGAPLYAFWTVPGHAKAQWRDGKHFAILRLTLGEAAFLVEFIAEDGTALCSQTFSL